MSCALPSRLGRSKADRVLAVQLVGDSSESGAEVLPEANLRVAAAGLLRDAREAGVRQVGRQHRLEAAWTDARLHRPRAPAAHADGVDHHVIVARAVDDLGLADETLTEADRAAVLPVAQHEDHATLFASSPNASSASSTARQSGVGASGAIAFGSAARSSSGFARERRTDGDLVPERADARAVVRAEPREELLRGGAQQRQVALHAARDVQHDDEADGLRGVVEQRDRLRLPFVAHLEVVPRERRDEAAVSIRHGDEDTDGVARAAENRLLPPGRAKHAQGHTRRVSRT